MSRCLVDTCELKYYAKGYCYLHYRRVLKDGNPGVRVKDIEFDLNEWYRNYCS
jgi:hypothetical protein